ncbi:MAG: hypothetical protein JNM56_02330 [Planctomycetia bacterium]|nr:hypothetical protein [Planctomycetia bacterium]
MFSPIVLTLNGNSYSWDGNHWYGTTDYTVPSLAIINRLNASIADQVAAEDAAVTDLSELLSRAKRAQATGQLQRALRLARRAFEGNRKHLGAAAVLCGVLREIGRPTEALAIANTAGVYEYPPILTTRAAALCDLGQWNEALRQINAVIANGVKRTGRGSDQALAVRGRIKANAPDLFEKAS